MAVKIGHASIDENGKIAGGKVGDQTGKEICIRDWYKKPWNVMLICTDEKLADKAAEYMEAICKDDSYGYDQSQRGTGYESIKKNGVAKGKGEFDCSSLVSVAVNLSYGKIKLGRYTTTGSIIDECRKMEKHFIILETGNPKKTHKGDMEIKKYKHVIMNV